MEIGIIPTFTSESPAPSQTQGVIAFHTVPNMIACSNGPIVWDDVTAGSTSFSLVVTNIGVPQGTSQNITGRFLKRQQVTPGPVNKTLVENMDPLAGGYNWNLVDVPQGWYIIEAYITPNNIINSNLFRVVNGSDTSCLTTVNSTSPGQLIPTSSSSFSSFHPSSPASSSSSGSVSTKKSNNTGIIAGSVVGGLVFIALVLFILFFFRGRFLSRRDRSTTWTVPPRSRNRDRLRAKGSHSLSDSTGAIAIMSPTNPPGGTQYPVSSEETSEEDLSSGVEKMVVNYNDTMVPPPLRTTASSSSSLRSQRTRSFTASAIQFQSESGLALQERDPWTPSRRSVDSGSHNQSLRQFDPYAFTPPLPVDAHSPKDYDRSSSGRRASRKPVPTYDVSELGSGDTGSVRGKERQVASRRSSVNELGEKSVHYLIPDLPLRTE